MQRKNCLSSISWRTEKLFTLQDLEWFLRAVVACCLPVVKEQHEEAGKKAFSWKTDEAQSLSYRVTRSPLKREFCVLMCVLTFCLEITSEPHPVAYFVWGVPFGFHMWDLWWKPLVTGTKMGYRHLVPDLYVCACAHREQVGGLAWSFHPAIFNIWTAHYAAEFKPLVFGMFTEVFPSETSKPNTGTGPWYLTSIQMGEGRAAGWVQERGERDTRDLICDINLNASALRSADRFNTVWLSQLSYYASPKD